VFYQKKEKLKTLYPANPRMKELLISLDTNRCLEYRWEATKYQVAGALAWVRRCSDAEWCSSETIRKYYVR